MFPNSATTTAASSPAPTTGPGIGTSGTLGPKRRKNAAGTPSIPKPKKQKLPRNLDSIMARNQLPDVPTGGAGGGASAAGGAGAGGARVLNRAGQRMVKGPYKKREKKDKDGKKIAAESGSGASTPTASGSTGGGARRGKGGKLNAASATGSTASQSGASSSSLGAASGENVTSRIEGGGSGGLQGLKDDEGDDNEGRAAGLQTNESGDATVADGADAGVEGKEDEDDDQEEEPEYTEYEWNQEASTRGRSKEELKALLDCFSDEQLQRYEVYRRSVLSRSTVKKLVGTILNQQITQTMAFVVAGFCKVYVGEMVEKAREVMEDWGETGAIRPEHLREAQRRYKKIELQHGQGVQTPHGYKRRMFCR